MKGEGKSYKLKDERQDLRSRSQKGKGGAEDESRKVVGSGERAEVVG